MTVTKYEEYVPRVEHEYTIFDRVQDSFVEIGRFSTTDKKLIVSAPIWLDDFQILLQALFQMYGSREEQRFIFGFDHDFLIVRRDKLCSVLAEDQQDPCQTPSRSPKESSEFSNMISAAVVDESEIEPFTPSTLRKG